MNNKDLVMSVLQSMERNKLAITQETNAYRRELKRLTSEPKYIKGRETLETAIRQTVRNLLHVGSLYPISETCDVLLGRHDNTYEMTIRAEIRSCFAMDTTIHFAYESAKAETVPKFIRNFMSALRTQTKFVGKKVLGNPDLLKRQVERAIKILKSHERATNKGVWLYFTDVRYAPHALAMRGALRLKTCMSKPIEEFYVLADGAEQVHPLDGYDYAPDFRLCLVSYHSPQNLKRLVEEHTDEYPFVGRAIVFMSEEKECAYNSIYGEEGVKMLFEQIFIRRSPYSCECYGVPVHITSVQDIVERTPIETLYKAEAVQDIQCIAAPFIDPFGGIYEVMDTELITREDGRKVLPLRTAPHPSMLLQVGERLEYVVAVSGVLFSAKCGDYADDPDVDYDVMAVVKQGVLYGATHNRVIPIEEL